MDIEILRDFIVLTRSESLTKAAHRLCMAPSTLSRHVAQLEKTLGVSLFVRKNDLRLSPEGEAVLEEASRIVGSYDGMVGRVRSLSEAAERTVRVVYRPEDRAMSDIACEAKAAIEAADPDARIVLLEPHGTSMLDMVDRGEADAALMYRPWNLDEERFGCVRVMRDDLVIGVNVRNPPKRREGHRLEDFAGRQFFYPLDKAFADYHDYIVGLFREKGVDIVVRYIAAETADQYYACDEEGRIWCFTGSSFVGGRNPISLVAQRNTLLCRIEEEGVDANRYAVYRSDDAHPLVPVVVEALERAGRVQEGLLGFA